MIKERLSSAVRAVKRRSSFVFSRTKQLFEPKTREKKLLSFLRTYLGQEHKFFHDLEKLTASGSIRKFCYEGQTVAIKSTDGTEMHGHNFKKLRKTFLAHHLLLKTGSINAKYYKLRSARVIGRIRNYLIMSFVEGKRADQMRFNNVEEEASFSSALVELRENFSELKKQGHIEQSPQFLHLIVAGKQQGKWVFYFPYDFG